MCGIAIIVDPNRDDNRLSLVKKMLITQQNRGIDELGIKDYGSFVMGHNRLKILGCANAYQPMSIANSEYIISFNGEIYNYREIKEDLLKIGVEFKTDTDTEIILHLYRLYGIKSFEQLNGMYSFVIYDNLKKQLLLARDPLGQKPLYIRSIGKKHYIASSIKSLILPEIGILQISKDSLIDYLLTSQVLGYQTFYKSIRHVTPGTYIKIDLQGNIIAEEEHCKTFFQHKSNITFEDATDILNSNLEKSLSRMTSYTSNVASHLSGGIDSSLMCSYLKNIEPTMLSYSCTYIENKYSISREDDIFEELKYAKFAAKHIGLRNFTVSVSPDDYYLHLIDIIKTIEEPKGNSCVAHYKLANYISQNHRIVMSGEGADELFGGYIWKLNTAFLAKENIEKSFFLKNLVDAPETLKFLYGKSYFEVFNKFKNFLCIKEYSTPLNAIMTYDLKVFLHYLLIQADKISSNFSMEGRYPYLDKDILRFALNLPQEMLYEKRHLGKPLLRNISQSILPNVITSRAKMGFTPPEGSWYKGCLLEMLKKIFIYNKESFVKELLGKDKIDCIINRHIDGKGNHRKLLWNLTSLEIWFQYFFKNKSTLD